MLWLGFSTLAVLALGGWHGGRVLSEHLRASRRLRERALDIEERKVQVDESKRRNPAAPPMIPPDLYRRITIWQDEASQADERKNILDLYEQFRDAADPWAEVRSHLPKMPDEHDALNEFAGGMLQ